MASMMERSRAAAKKRKQREDEEKKKKEKKALSPATRKQPESRRADKVYPKGNRAGKQGALGRTKATKTADYDAAFNKEFAAARKELGRGGVFTYTGPGPRKGRKFTTDRADDKPAGGFSKIRSGDTGTTISKGIPKGKKAQDDRATGVTRAKKKGLLGRFRKGIKDAFVPTNDEPKPPGGKRPDKIQTRRGQPVGPWARYDEEMKSWRAKQKRSGMKAGGRVGKPAKKAASRRSSVGMKAGGRVGKAAKTAARTSVKKKFPRRP